MSFAKNMLLITTEATTREKYLLGAHVLDMSPNKTQLEIEGMNILFSIADKKTPKHDKETYKQLINKYYELLMNQYGNRDTWTSQFLGREILWYMENFDLLRLISRCAFRDTFKERFNIGSDNNIASTKQKIDLNAYMAERYGELVGDIFHLEGDQIRNDELSRLDKNCRELAVKVYEGSEEVFALHDALLDCGAEGYAQHFGTGCHVKGCWALDTILRKRS